MTSDEEIDRAIPEGLKLYRFQYQAVRFLVERNRALLASDVGTGKSIVQIVAANLLKTTGPILVLCPKSIVPNWQREINKWALSPERWHVQNWDRLLCHKNPPAVFSCDHYDLIICDESHVALKNPNTWRCKIFFKSFLPKAERIWLATATPASTSGLDYYATLKILLPTLFTENKWQPRDFEKEFCVEQYNPFARSKKKYSGFRNTDVLKKLFSKTMLRHRAEEVLPDLPPVLYTNLPVEVSPEIVAAHSQINVEEVIACIEEGRPMPGSYATVAQATALAKMDAAVEWIENFPETESLLIFCWFHSVIEELTQRLSISTQSESLKPLVITGRTEQSERQAIVDLFQGERRRRLICNTVAGGLGLTLVAARTALYIEAPLSPTTWTQSQGRIRRIGSTGNHIHIVKMEAIGCIDERIWQVLEDRQRKLAEVRV